MAISCGLPASAGLLIDNSLRYNVALGEEESEIDDVHLRETLHQARLTELVEQLPQGVDTILGERNCTSIWRTTTTGRPRPGLLSWA